MHSVESKSKKPAGGGRIFEQPMMFVTLNGEADRLRALTTKCVENAANAQTLPCKACWNTCVCDNAKYVANPFELVLAAYAQLSLAHRLCQFFLPPTYRFPNTVIILYNRFPDTG